MKKNLATTLLLLLFALGSFAQQSMYVSASKLNMRSDSSLSATIITKLSKGSEVTLLEKGGAWAKVQYGSSFGYVAFTYLSATKPYIPTKAENYVLICNSENSYAYHSHYCHGLNRCKASVSKVTISQAKAKGYRACGICY
jgi:uncharacterized protein YgiM (DUF1202 family)